MVLLCVGWEQKVTVFDYIPVRGKKNEFSPSQQSRGLFSIFLQSAEKKLLKAFAPQCEHIIGLNLHSIH